MPTIYRAGDTYAYYHPMLDETFAAVIDHETAKQVKVIVHGLDDEPVARWFTHRQAERYLTPKGD